ncbi:MAG TPA: hypothetical protein VGP50_06350 [Stellaceae bacterium]|jgi:hypothetical protein|nr:hypothetical protein [Stellaceae bacterium]
MDVGQHWIPLGDRPPEPVPVLLDPEEPKARKIWIGSWSRKPAAGIRLNAAGGSVDRRYQVIRRLEPFLADEMGDKRLELPGRRARLTHTGGSKSVGGWADLSLRLAGGANGGNYLGAHARQESARVFDPIMAQIFSTLLELPRQVRGHVRHRRYNRGDHAVGNI